MKKQIPLLLLLSFCVVTSCKKKNETKIETQATGGLTTTTSRIKTVKTTNSPGDTSLTTYSYDGEKLAKITSSDGSFSTCNWSASQMVYTSFTSSNAQPDEKLTYKLNGLGQTVNVSGSFSSNALNEDCQYNADGYLSGTTLTFNGGTTTTTFTITGGNTTSSRTKDMYSTNTSVSEFYTDKVNTIGNLNIGFGIAGKQNANLEKTITTISQNGSQSDTSVTSNTYEFDTKNRVSKKISFNGIGNTVTLYSYYE